MDTVTKRQLVPFPLGVHTSPAIGAVVAINFGKHSGTIEAKRLKGCIGIFCSKESKSKKSDLIHRFHLTEIKAARIYPMCRLSKEEDLVVFAYISASCTLVIEALHVGLLAEVSFPPGAMLEVKDACTPTRRP